MKPKVGEGKFQFERGLGVGGRRRGREKAPILIPAHPAQHTSSLSPNSLRTASDLSPESNPKRGSKTDVSTGFSTLATLAHSDSDALRATIYMMSGVFPCSAFGFYTITRFVSREEVK